jgi:hypothetical protein
VEAFLAVDPMPSEQRLLAMELERTVGEMERLAGDVLGQAEIQPA